MPFIIAPLGDVKGLNNYPEYIKTLEELQAAARARASTIWGGAGAGGLTPGPDQYGLGPFRKNDMAGDTTDSTPSGSYTFRKSITATGWQDIFNYTVRQDMIHAFAGFLISDDVLRILQLRMRGGSTNLPIWDSQEAQRYDKFAIIIKADAGAPFVADQKTSMLIRIYAETVGFQRVVPLGFQLFRRPDLVINET